MTDMTCLADGIVIPDTPGTEGNRNTLVVGSTGSGKSVSIIYPKLLHTYEASIIVPLSKVDVMKHFSTMMKKRNYNVEIMDFINPQNSTVCYEPLAYINNDEDIKSFALNMVGTQEVRNMEPYWYEAAANVISAEIMLIMQNAEYAGKKARFSDVVKLHEVLKLCGSELAYTNLDIF